MFVLDASGTYNAATFRLIVEYLVSVVTRLDVEGDLVRVGLLSYSDIIFAQIPLGSLRSRAQLIAAIRGLAHLGRRTDTPSALALLRTSGFTGSRPQATRVAVLITNGDSVSQTRTIDEAQRVKTEAGVLLLTLSVGTWRNVFVMTKIASYPYWKNMMMVDDAALLNTAVRNLSDALCNNIRPCDQVPQPCQNSGTCMNFVTDYICNCTGAWFGPDCSLRACNGSADIVLALDASGSIGDENFRQETQFVTNVVAALDFAFAPSPSRANGVRIGLLTFSDNVSVQFQLNTFTDRRQLLEAVNVPYTRGSTNTAYAIQVARQRLFVESSGDRPDVPNVLVVLTDGLSNDPNQTWQEAMLTRHTNITIITVGVGEYNIDELRAIASDPLASNVLTTSDFTTLARDLTEKLRNALCNDGTFCNSNPCLNGGICRNVLGGFVCDCPESATGIICERGGTGIIDLMFVIDGSGSIQNERFVRVKQLLVSIVEQLEIRIDRTRVGVIYYSDRAVLAFNLIRYTVRQDLIEAINRINFIGNRTNTAAALRLLYTEAFTPMNGDRPDVRNVAIVLTDGGSNINPEMTVVEATRVRQSGTRVITGTLGDFVNMVEINMIASRPLDKNVFVALTYNDTERTRLALQLVNSTTDVYNECLTSPCINGGNCSDEYYDFTCSCPAFFSGFNCGWECRSQFDVVMILDLSGSVQAEYELVIALTRAVVTRLDIDHDNARFGVITYATNVSDVIYMNESVRAKRKLLNGLEFYHVGGFTNTQAALHDLRTLLLDPARGYRSPAVPTRAVLVSDGQSNVLPERTVPEANATKALGVLMYSVVINVENNMAEMRDVSSDPNNYVYVLPNKTYVESVADELVRDLCRP